MQSFHLIGRRCHGPGFPWQRPHDKGGPSSDTAESSEPEGSPSAASTRRWSQNKRRTSLTDLPTGPVEPKPTVPSVEDEAVIVAFPRHGSPRGRPARGRSSRRCRDGAEQQQPNFRWPAATGSCHTREGSEFSQARESLWPGSVSKTCIAEKVIAFSLGCWLGRRPFDASFSLQRIVEMLDPQLNLIPYATRFRWHATTRCYRSS